MVVRAAKAEPAMASPHRRWTPRAFRLAKRPLVVFLGIFEEVKGYLRCGGVGSRERDKAKSGCILGSGYSPMKFISTTSDQGWDREIFFKKTAV